MIEVKGRCIKYSSYCILLKKVGKRAPYCFLLVFFCDNECITPFGKILGTCACCPTPPFHATKLVPFPHCQTKTLKNPHPRKEEEEPAADPKAKGPWCVFKDSIHFCYKVGLYQL